MSTTYPGPLHRPSWRGRTNVDALTILAIEAAEKRAGFTFVVTQGSYQSSVAASAGTHDGGGAVDLRTRDLSSGQRHAMVLALRQVGFAAWLRTPSQGPWVEHVHAVLVDHPKLSASAARQVVAYRAGRNGLANNGPDDGPRVDPIPVFKWPEPKPPAAPNVRAFLRAKTRADRLRALRKVTGKDAKPHAQAWLAADKAQQVARATVKQTKAEKKAARRALRKVVSG